MSADDRFLLQGKQILPKICQVRPMPTAFEAKVVQAYRLFLSPILMSECLYRVSMVFATIMLPVDACHF